MPAKSHGRATLPAHLLPYLSSVLRLILFLTLLTCSAAAQTSLPPGLSPYMQGVIREATEFMNISRYDSAQVVISEAFQQSEFALHAQDLYYLHCYEAEIMYYNALFEQGLNSAMRGLEIARQLRDPLLEGSAENLTGLFLMSLQRYREAIPHFSHAARLLPDLHGNEFLSFRYHALANHGECLVKLNMPDSAMRLSRESIRLARMAGRDRGVALGHWNIAEAWLLRNEPDSAVAIGYRALEIVYQSPHRDAVQVICATLMKAASSRNQFTEALAWMERGMIEMDNPLNTDLTRIQFLEECIAVMLHFGEAERALGFIRQLDVLRRTVNSSQQEQRVAILRDYYEKNQNLVLARQEARVREKDLQLRNALLGTLAVLIIALVVVFVIVRMNSRQRRRIEQLQHEDQLRETRREMEIESLHKRMNAVYGERNRIASDLHDDMGAALSSIRIYSEAAQKQWNTRPEESLRLMARIQGSSTGMMERMSDIIWSINPDNDSGQSLVLRMKSTAGELLGPLDVPMRFVVDAEVEALVPTMHARRNLYLLFKEAVHNMAKYSQCTAAHCTLQTEGQTLTMTLEDNGRGFDPEHTPAGNGRKTMLARAQALGGTLLVRSAPGRGTRIILKASLTLLTG